LKFNRQTSSIPELCQNKFQKWGSETAVELLTTSFFSGFCSFHYM